MAKCCYKLLHSDLFQENQQYVRRQILYCLLEVGLLLHRKLMHNTLRTLLG